MPGGEGPLAAAQRSVLLFPDPDFLLHTEMLVIR